MHSNKAATDLCSLNILSHPRLKISEEFLEGGHVSGFQHLRVPVLLQATPVLSNSRIQDPGQVVARVLQHPHVTFAKPSLLMWLVSTSFLECRVRQGGS